MTDALMVRLAALGHPEVRAAHGAVFEFLDDAGTRVSVLADRARMTKQSMTELVAHLERHGYVERVPDPADGRAKLVRATARGREVYAMPGTRCGTSGAPRRAAGGGAHGDAPRAPPGGRRRAHAASSRDGVTRQPPGVELAVLRRSRSSAADGAHRAVGLDEARLVHPVLELLAPDRPRGRASSSSSSLGAGPHRRAQVRLVQREQAGAQLAVGRHPDAVAVRAERLGRPG